MTASAVARQPLRDLLETGPRMWEDLLGRMDSASPFLSWHWHRAWLDSVAVEEAKACEAIVLHGEQGRIEAILPLCRRSVRFRRLRLDALTWAVGDAGCPDHLDVPAAPGSDMDALVAELETLEWPLLILSNLAANGPNHAQLAREFERRGYAVRRRPLLSAPYLELPSSWDEYLASLSSNRRQTIRRKERKLQREHDVRVIDYGLDRLEEGWKRLFALHRQRWEGTGAFRNPALIGLHRRFMAGLAERGELWLTSLEVDGRPAAAWYGFAYRGTVSFYQSGRDPSFDRHSVGDVLMAIMIRRAIEHGYRLFDFLRGDERYKARWTSTARMLEELIVFRRGFRGRCLHLLDRTAEVRAQLRARRVKNGPGRNGDGDADPNVDGVDA